MTDRIEAARTACLMQGMAARLGVDPLALARTGGLAQAEVDAMVARCRACVKGDDCIVWMVERDKAGAAPGYCLNGEELEALRR